jgi:ParB-like chromosome segregation protein Spo0J
VPVLVGADGEVIAGHGRILAATHLGLTDAPVIAVTLLYQPALSLTHARD